MGISTSRRNRPTKNRRWLTAAIGLVILLSFHRLANAQVVPPSDFAAYCQNVSNGDARYTLRIMMRTLKEDDYKLAETQLQKYRNLSFPKEGIVSVEPLSCVRHVVGLNLAENKIFDAGPLQELVSLETALLQDNLIEDIQFLRKMSSLKRLNLARNRLKDVSNLRFNKAIVNLSLGGNSGIKNVDFLKQLKLVKLALNGTSTASSIENIMPQSDLIELDLSQMGLVDCSTLGIEGNLPKIRKLLLPKNRIQSIDWLKNLKSLRALDIAGNPVNSIAALKLHKNLVALNISATKATDQNEIVSHLSGLLELYARECGLKDISWLKELNDKMRTLDLADNQIVDVSPIYKFSHLKVLRLNGNPIPDIDIQWLRSLKHLQDFDIDIPGIESLEKRRELIDLRAKIIERKRISN